MRSEVQQPEREPYRQLPMKFRRAWKLRPPGSRRSREVARQVALAAAAVLAVPAGSTLGGAPAYASAQGADGATGAAARQASARPGIAGGTATTANRLRAGLVPQTPGPWVARTGFAEGLAAAVGVACSPGGSGLCAAVGTTTGGGGAVALSTDAGATWSGATLAATVSNDNLLGASCVTAADCVAVGSDPTGSSAAIVATTDGGGTWTAQTAPGGTGSLASVACVTAADCVAVGGDTATNAPVLVATTDGGGTWTPGTPPLGTSLDAVSCATASNCVVLGQTTGSSPVVATTSDAGLTWAHQPPPPGRAPLRSVSCATASDCAAVGADAAGTSGEALETTDGGATWTDATLPVGIEPLTSVSCASSSCVAVGSNPKSATAPTILTSTDGGRTWANATPPAGAGPLVTVSCATTRDCVAVGATTRGAPLAVSTTDGGASWASHGVAGSFGALTTVSCSSASDCVAAGLRYGSSGFSPLLVATTDGGTAWSRATPPSGTGWLTSVSCPNANDCVAVGINATALANLTNATNNPGGAAVITVTTDGGATWSPVTVPTGLSSLASVSCAGDTADCFAVGSTATQSVVVSNEVLTPQVATMIPSAGTTAGGTQVSIFGSKFSAATAVSFGTTPAASFTVDSATEITATTAAGTAGSVDVTVTGPAGTSPVVAADRFTYVTPAQPDPYHPLSPSRICDTRASQPQNQCTGKTLGAGSTVTVQAAGNGGVPASGVTAVVVNVTVTDTTAGSYLTVFPAGQSPPTASSANWPAGATVADLATVALSSSGALSVTNANGSADVAVDVEGYFAPATRQGAGLYEALAEPARVCDTRPANPSQLSGTVLTQCEGKAPGAKSSLDVQVTGEGGVPSTGVGAVVLDVTAVDPAGGGYLTVYPATGTAPVASNVNYKSGATVPNRVIVAVSSSGAIAVYASGGNPQVLVDVAGYVTDGSNAQATGAIFTPAAAPVRVCDTRSGLSYTTPCTTKTLGPAGTLTATVAGTDGIPSAVTAVVATVTATNTTAAGWLTVWPAQETRPTTSDLNWASGETTPNLVIATVSPSGQIEIYNAFGTADVVVDVVGWFST